MKNVKFRHRNCDRAFTPATFAYELPPAAMLKQTLIRELVEPQIINGLIFMFGKSCLHPVDQYCKAKGREEALKKLKPTIFQICEWSSTAQRTNFKLTDGEVLLTFSVGSSDDKVRLDHIEFV